MTLWYPFHGPRPGEAIAFNPVDGLLYHASGVGMNRVFESLDPITLTVTNIVTSGDAYSEITGIGFNPENGALYFSDLGTDLSTLTTQGIITDVAVLPVGRFKGLVMVPR